MSTMCVCGVGVWCTWRCMLWVCGAHGGVSCGCVVYMEMYVVGVRCTWRCMLWV